MTKFSWSLAWSVVFAVDIRVVFYDMMHEMCAKSSDHLVSMNSRRSPTIGTEEGELVDSHAQLSSLSK